METQHITFSEVPKKAQSKIKSGEFRATLAQSPHTNRRFCSLATSVAQKTGLCGARGFRGISSTGEKMPVCGIPRPLDRAGILSPTQTLIPLVYDAPASGASYALHSGVVAASRQFKSFWFRTPKPLVPIFTKRETYHSIYVF